MCEYKGDMILIDRLSEFFNVNSLQWNKGEKIELNDISYAIQDGKAEERAPFGDDWKHLCMENKSTEWHIGRIIYFINHPEEIMNVEIDNLCNGNYICPIPVIVDGNHRLMAAIWLNNEGKMKEIHCLYGGRQDLLDYLTGKTDYIPIE